MYSAAVWLYNIMFEKRKVIITGKLVGISEAIRLILIFLNTILANLCLNFASLNFKLASLYSIFAILNSSSTHGLIHKCQSVYPPGYKTNELLDSFPLSDIDNKPILDPDSAKFNEWLAGLIDGDGYFILTKKGYTSCEICMDARDKKALYQIKHKYGGAIKPVSGAKALKYKLRNKKGLVYLIKGINGLIRNPILLLQINKLCNKYGIDLIYPRPLRYNNGWLSGFIDSDGSIYLNEQSGQIFISATQKNRFSLEPLIGLYGGIIDILSPKIEAFKYVYIKSELLSLIDNYFRNYPLKTEKAKRLNLTKQFYDLRTYGNNKNKCNADKLNAWVSYKNRWEKFKD